jgi:hypothetical protein
MDGRAAAAVTLGVPVDATREQIQRAFRSAVKRVHPDVVAAGSGAPCQRASAESFMALRRARDELLVDAVIEEPVAPVVAEQPVRQRSPRFFAGWTDDPAASARLDLLDQPRAPRRAPQDRSASEGDGQAFARYLAQALAA